MRSAKVSLPSAVNGCADGIFCNTGCSACAASSLAGQIHISMQRSLRSCRSSTIACALMVQDSMPSDSNRQSASDTVIRTAVRASSSASGSSRICVNGVLLFSTRTASSSCIGKTVQHSFTFHDDSAMHGAATRIPASCSRCAAGTAPLYPQSCTSSSIVTG